MNHEPLDSFFSVIGIFRYQGSWQGLTTFIPVMLFCIESAHMKVPQSPAFLHCPGDVDGTPK